MSNDEKIVEIVQADGMTMMGRGPTNHWVVMDGPEDFGGHDAGTRPMELLLMSLGGCTGMDVISLMKKMRIPYTGLKITVSANRRDEHPKYYTNIHIHYMVYGKDLPEDKVKKAIDLSQEKYCSISYMLSKSSDLTYDYEIIEE